MHCDEAWIHLGSVFMIKDPSHELTIGHNSNLIYTSWAFVPCFRVAKLNYLVDNIFNHAVIRIRDIMKAEFQLYWCWLWAVQWDQLHCCTRNLSPSGDSFIIAAYVWCVCAACMLRGTGMNNVNFSTQDLYARYKNASHVQQTQVKTVLRMCCVQNKRLIRTIAAV